MIAKKAYLMVTFHTTAAAIQTEKLCKQEDIPGRLMPVPRAITSDCGIGWKCDTQYREKLALLLEENHVEVDIMHSIE